MAFSKQSFYEGAALHLLIRNNEFSGIRYEDPFFVLDSGLRLYLKYSTKVRSPWQFTFMNSEQKLLRAVARRESVVIGLICANDGVAALPFNRFVSIAPLSDTAIHVACY